MSEVTRTQGILLTVFVCCGWPILFNLIITYAWKWFTRRDWSNVPWHQLWSKDQ